MVDSCLDGVQEVSRLARQAEQPFEPLSCDLCWTAAIWGDGLAGEIDIHPVPKECIATIDLKN